MFDLPLALLHSDKDHCDGIWTTILMMLFPPSKNYLLTPMCRITENSPLVMELQTMSTTPTFQLRTVLVIDIRKTRHWQAGIPGQEMDIKGLTDAAFNGSLSEYANARSKVYWISVIGRHWRYGVSDGRDSRPLIDWHTIDDEDSYKDLQELADLVERL
jgi:hypothetical protein